MIEVAETTSCPNCSSYDIRDKRKYKRSVRTFQKVETVEVIQHCCRKCQKTFTDRVNGVGYRAQIADEVKDVAAETYLEGPDLKEVEKVMWRIGKVRISVSSICRTVQNFTEAAFRVYNEIVDSIEEIKYGCIDEKFVSVHGKKKPQQFVIEPLWNLPIAQKLLRKRTEAAIYRVLAPLKKKGLLVVVADDFKSYSPVLKRLKILLQKCIFHAKQAISRIMKSKHIQKKRARKFKKWLFAFLDSKNLEEAKVWLKVIGRIKKEKKLQRFMKSFLHDWECYFTYLRFEGCPKTTNHSEQYNRRFEQKVQTVHGFRTERTGRSFNALYTLYTMFRKFEEGTNKGKSPLEMAGIQLAQMDMFAVLRNM